MLALLLALQWATAFAHCLAPLGLAAPGSAAVGGAAGGHAVEICTADGIRLMLLDGEDPAPAPHPHDSCPLCPGGAAPGPEAPSPPAVAIRYAVTLPPPVAGLPPAPARAPPQQPRAPPIA